MNWEKFKEPIGRMQYFKRILPIGIIYAIFTNGNWVPEEYHWLVVLTVLACLMLSCVFAAQRMRDMNWNPWLSLLACVPIVGLVIGLCCLINRSKHIEPSRLEQALGRNGADSLIRNLKTAIKAGDAGDKELEQTLGRKALLDAALSAAQEAFRNGNITSAQRDVISDNMRSNPKTSTLMDELLDAQQLNLDLTFKHLDTVLQRPGLEELISTGRLEEYATAKHRALEMSGDFEGMAKAEALHHIGNAMKDFSTRVFNAPGVVLGNLAEGTPEFLNIDEYVKALQALQDDTSCWYDGCSKFVHAMHGWSRLEQVFGKDGAKKALQDAYDAQKNGASTITIETAGYPEYGIQPTVVTMKIVPKDAAVEQEAKRRVWLEKTRHREHGPLLHSDGSWEASSELHRRNSAWIRHVENCTECDLCEDIPATRQSKYCAECKVLLARADAQSAEDLTLVKVGKAETEEGEQTK